MLIRRKEGSFLFRRAEPSKGILLSFCINLIFRFEWAVLALLLLGLHLWLGIPWYFSLLAASLWILISLAITLVLYALNRLDRGRPQSLPNKNPYSKTNDSLPKKE